MSLTNLSQIKGGQLLRNDVNVLMTSYDAAKVLTNIKTGTQKDGKDEIYDVNTLLTNLKSGLETISGGSGTSLATLQTAIDNIKGKSIKDIVRVTPTAAYADSKYTITLPTGFDASKAVPSMDDTVALPVYNTDNSSVLDENGAQLTYSFKTNTFSGVPSVVDVAASAKKTDGSYVYKPLAAGFTFKVFPTGSFTFNSLPADSLLDNEEFTLISYDKAINKLVVELAKDSDVINAVTEKVGTETVTNQIKAITDVLAARITTLETDTVKKADIATTIRQATGAEGTAANTLASDDKVASEKAVATVKSGLDANIKTNTDAITALQTSVSAVKSTADSAVQKANISTTVPADATTAVDTKVSSEKSVATAIAAVNTSLSTLGTEANQNKADIAALQTSVGAVKTTADGAIQKTDIATAVPDDATTAADTKVVSEKAVATAFTTAKNALASVDANLSERITAVEKIVTPIHDKFAVTAETATTSWTLSATPNASLVKMYINHMIYVEGDDFTVDRATKAVTWTLTAAAGGFDITGGTNGITDSVRFEYQSGSIIANASTITILHQNEVPTTGTYKVGDMVYKTSPVTGGNIGWVCTKAGTPGTWMEIGVADFAHTIYVTEAKTV